MSSIFDQVNKFFGVGEGKSRPDRINDAIKAAEEGKKADKPTLGNPGGKKKKKQSGKKKKK